MNASSSKKSPKDVQIPSNIENPNLNISHDPKQVAETVASISIDTRSADVIQDEDTDEAGDRLFMEQKNLISYSVVQVIEPAVELINARVEAVGHSQHELSTALEQLEDQLNLFIEWIKPNNQTKEISTGSNPNSNSNSNSNSSSQVGGLVKPEIGNGSDEGYFRSNSFPCETRTHTDTYMSTNSSVESNEPVTAANFGKTKGSIKSMIELGKQDLNQGGALDVAKEVSTVGGPLGSFNLVSSSSAYKGNLLEPRSAASALPETRVETAAGAGAGAGIRVEKDFSAELNMLTQVAKLHKAKVESGRAKLNETKLKLDKINAILKKVNKRLDKISLTAQAKVPNLMKN